MKNMLCRAKDGCIYKVSGYCTLGISGCVYESVEEEIIEPKSSDKRCDNCAYSLVNKSVNLCICCNRDVPCARKEVPYDFYCKEFMVKQE